ncbi:MULTISPECIES: DUF1778 domain-containing protein [Sphingobium]|uniref:DUF1778 domain-containing protein n=3 Tax=Sphingobium TaxID=165695 RepID=T0HUJ1_9SPHN|nr:MULTISPECIES: DUF1778 domain-containing protein [Sphingobium]EQB16777.1 hypothetical protein RLDS_06570 [Sphingobium lactosutens DS20]QDC36624.1 DUF1778 domain-containing protein [Sphingobium fuliginis ATCC 27551]QNG43891.1 DUF1778 domain-containing protein [Sphingobium yanoikuyae]
MNAVQDISTEIDERASERMNFRMKPRVKKAIQRAAALSGVDDSVFAVNALYNAALTTISTHEHTRVTARDFAAILDALDNPPEPTEAMIKAVEGYKRRVTSR